MGIPGGTEDTPEIKDSLDTKKVPQAGERCAGFWDSIGGGSPVGTIGLGEFLKIEDGCRAAVKIFNSHPHSFIRRRR